MQFSSSVDGNTRLHTGAPAPLSYTLQDASRVTGLSIATLRRKEKEGALRFYKVGFRTLVAAPSLHALLTGEAA
ncbi:helix-turn-helix domain-containing protein [Roseomonas hellenica]|uniref:Helix-turn-helix domain-containing protein n=1 Tax=Plastoroseomonas hellenica TaxID=2687306 RepID=A0ABS5F6U1_9PROT|nr:helix-turn-helix domain-containing protein [Plastoroseomonas hellenica]MBR0668278.1 helix-turn-helix domain-containing protein [Plastoroseomonas hellenica]